MVDNVQAILVEVFLPFAVIAAGITLTMLIIILIIAGFWRLVGGSD